MSPEIPDSAYFHALAAENVEKNRDEDVLPRV